VISKAIKVKRNEISRIMEFLKNEGLLIEGLKIIKDGDFAFLPVKSVPEGYDSYEMNFEEIPRIRSYIDLVKIPEDLKKYLPRSMDIVGNVAIVKLNENIIEYSREIGNAIMLFNKNIKTVALDRGVKGEFRVRDLEVIVGDGLETVHRENGIRIFIDLGNVYFSPRLSKERSRILSLVRDGETILDLFCGSGAFSILIGKKRKVKIYSVDKNPRAIECLRESIRINKIDNIVPILDDVRTAVNYIPNGDRAIMDLPMESINLLDFVINKSSYFHIYYKTNSPDDVKNFIEGKGLKVENYGLVHGYSPSEGMYYFDARRGA
jgi:tRNA (guanine37-N1)-methyltransferase